MAPAVTVTVTVQDTISIQVTSAPEAGPTGSGGRPGYMTPDYMIISITNMYGRQASLSLASDSESPAPVGNPTATALPPNSFTQYAFPTNWAGRISVGPNLHPDGSKIEGSFTGAPDIDVSYVDGYTVPITCSSDGIPVTGCNVDLFKQRNVSCPQEVDGPVCLNPAQTVPDGPAPAFFQACAGAAYTYPKDDGANVSGMSRFLSCCIGTSCEAPLRQPNQLQRRFIHRHRRKRELLPIPSSIKYKRQYGHRAFKMSMLHHD